MKNNVQSQKKEVAVYHRLPINYVDGTTGNGEFHDTFYSNHSPDKLGIQYSVKNKGTQQFSWKMIDSDGKLWAQRTLAAGKAHTAILEKGSYTMPEGMYSMSIITIDGAEGMFDFVVKLVE
ncbi:hypothetical protein [Lysinibacillus fusiformis]|uniref:hypothetical protein n=1 Tax=Lysinibacillus fusiformis TaxID=28031 RepID=UPI002ED1E8C8